jgi:phage shock protein C
MSNHRVLYRLPKEGKISGVCAGLADYFDLDATLVRLIFVAFAIISFGTAVLIYIIMAIIIPENRDQLDDTITEKASRFGKELQDGKAIGWVRNYFGIGIVIIGLLLLVEQIFPNFINFRWSFIWPVALILVGIAIIFRKRR